MKKFFYFLAITTITLFTYGCGSDDVDGIAGGSTKINPPGWIIGQWEDLESKEELGGRFWMVIEFTKNNFIYDSTGFYIDLRSGEKGKLGIVEQVKTNDRFKFKLIEYSEAGIHDSMTLDFKKIAHDEIEIIMDFIGPFTLKKIG